ncbi:MAG: FKBP-type peptidyl-prolyl cis-trans isomerase [Balneolia bacterium]|nr:FKBP-type peptidyl-prolyl cis-trans isomerase [Balneolia bacterium]
MLTSKSFLSVFALFLSSTILFSCGQSETEYEADFPEGLQVEDTVVGDGELASEGDIVLVHYTGYLENGEIFDSSQERGPFSFQIGVGQVIEGWDKGFQGMRVGGQRTLIMAPELAYGETGAGGGAIPPNATLTFEVELLDVTREPDSVWDYDEDDVVTTESGLQYVIIAEGEGDAVESGDMVHVHYDGFLTDGTLFDTSVRRGQPLVFQVGVGRVIQGWDEGLVGMRLNEQRVLIIPSDLAYGDQARGDLIPAGATLLFNVNVVDIIPAD